MIRLRLLAIERIVSGRRPHKMANMSNDENSCFTGSNPGRTGRIESLGILKVSRLTTKD
jgi:hypothetical protein